MQNTTEPAAVEALPPVPDNLRRAIAKRLAETVTREVYYGNETFTGGGGGMEKYKDCPRLFLDFEGDTVILRFAGYSVNAPNEGEHLKRIGTMGRLYDHSYLMIERMVEKAKKTSNVAEPIYERGITFGINDLITCLNGAEPSPKFNVNLPLHETQAGRALREKEKPPLEVKGLNFWL